MPSSNEWVLDPHEAKGLTRIELKDHIQSGSNIHHTEYIHMNVPKRYGLVNITSPVEEILKRSKIKDGFCFVSTMHITAGVYMNDAEAGLLKDIAHWIERLAPFGKEYEHHLTGEDNADAHLKSYLTNHFLMAPVTRAALDFGRWQQIFYAEFDGKREKRILVKITGIGA